MNRWASLFISLLLVAATYFSLTTFDRFVPVIDQMIVNPLFLDGMQHWREEGSGNVLPNKTNVTIKSMGTGTYMVFQTVPIDMPGYYRISFRARAEQIAIDPNAGSWAGPGILLRYVKDDGKRKYGTPTFIPSGAGQNNFQLNKFVQKDATAVDVGIWIREASGQILLESISLSKLEQTRSYGFLKIITLVVWSLIGVALVVSAVRAMSIFNFLGVVTLCGVALLGALMPEELLKQVIQNLSAIFPQNLLPPDSLRKDSTGIFNHVDSNHVFADFGHLIVFTGLGFFAVLNGRKFGFIFLVASALVFALTTEVLQLLVARRTASLNDLLVDVAGVLLGLILGYICLLLYEKIRD